MVLTRNQKRTLPSNHQISKKIKNNIIHFDSDGEVIEIKKENIINQDVLDINSDDSTESSESESESSESESDTESYTESSISGSDTESSIAESEDYTISDESDDGEEYAELDNDTTDINDATGESCVETDADNESNVEYKDFQKNVYSIFNGTFFDTSSLSYTMANLKKDITLDKVTQLNIVLNKLKDQFKTNKTDIVDILEMNLSITQKSKVLEKLYHIANSDILSSEYNSHLADLTKLINNDDSEELKELEDRILNNLNNNNDSYKNQILKSNMSFNNKVNAYKYTNIMESYGNNSSSEEQIKYKTWLNTLLSIPFGKYHESNITCESPVDEIKNYLTNIRTTLDKNLSYLEKPKDQIINVISQMVRNPKSNINAIGLYGARGIGKSHFIESIAEALNRPLKRISLGGNSDASLLNGHNFTYIGSKPGKIVDALIDSKIMNPIIFLDEVDKISNTEHGKEITGTLIHLTDSTTNSTYNCDDYFSGIDIDLSRVLFIFTYNDPTSIDPILADRIYKINISNYSCPEKLEITNNHLINTVIKSFNFKTDDITFEPDAVEYIIETSKNSKGMRSIKSKIQIIISRINTLLLTDNKIINLKYKSLYSCYNKLPILIQRSHIDILLEDSLAKENTPSTIEYSHMYL